MKNKLARYRAVAQEFVTEVKSFASVAEIAVFASVAGGDPYPSDVDLALFLSSLEELPRIGKIKRRLESKVGGLDVFLFDRDRKFLGTICPRRDCPGRARDCSRPDCGRTPFIEKREGLIVDPLRWFRTPVEVLFSRIDNGILIPWQRELLVSIGRDTPESHPIRETLPLKCVECGDRFEFDPGEQKHFEKMGFTNPKRCPACREKKERCW